MRQPPVVHHNRIHVPEVYGRKIAGQNLLRLDAFRAPAGHILALGRVVQRFRASLRQVYTVIALAFAANRNGKGLFK